MSTFALQVVWNKGLSCIGHLGILIAGVLNCIHSLYNRGCLQQNKMSGDPKHHLRQTPHAFHEASCIPEVRYTRQQLLYIPRKAVALPGEERSAAAWCWGASSIQSTWTRRMSQPPRIRWCFLLALLAPGWHQRGHLFPDCFYPKVEKQHMGEEAPVRPNWGLLGSTGALLATKRSCAFACCQAPPRCSLMNDVNKAGVLPSPAGVLSLGRCNPGVWEKDVHAVNLLLFK